MSLTTVLQQLKKAHLEHKITLIQEDSWHKLQQDAFVLLDPHLSKVTTAEKYKYTPIHKLLPADFNYQYRPSIHPAQPHITSKDLSDLLPVSIIHYAIVLTNGIVHEVTYDLNKQLPFKLIKFSEATGKDQKLLHNYFEKYLGNLADPFAIINTSFFTDGILIQIPENTVLAQPICIYNYTTASNNVTYPRVLISIGKNSCVSVINNWHTASHASTYTNAVVDIQLDDYAKLTHYNLQLQGHNAYQIINTNCSQQAHSEVNSYTFIGDHKILRNNLSYQLEGTHAKNSIYGVYYLRDAQHVDNHIIVNHQQPYTESEQLYKGVLTDNATGVFHGSIYVQPEAQKTLAFQSNNNILLSDNASMHTKPQLEILADDVKCSHGATFGSLDKNQIFYLQSRGIPTTMAKQMLLQAFIDQIIHQVPSVSIQAFVQKELQRCLQDVES